MPQNKIGGWTFLNVIMNFQAPNKRKLPDQRGPDCISRVVVRNSILQINISDTS